MKPQIEIENLTLRYDRFTALENVSLTVCEGDFLGIVGPNGGGKSSLLRAILGLEPIAAGSIRFFRDGEPVPALRIGYLPQKNPLDLQFPISVREVIAAGLMREKRRFAPFSKEQREQIETVTEAMGLTPFADRPIGKLSGGQLQRTLLGRALIGDPEVLILDEPTVFIDNRFEERFDAILQSLRTRKTVLFVSHERESLARWATRIVEVNTTLTTLSPTD